jgi:hypothetical protein
MNKGKWYTLLMTGEDTGLVGPYGHKFEHSPEFYPRINVCEVSPVGCVWREDDPDSNSWESDCGMSFYLADETELDWKYCPKCGRNLIAEHWEPDHE